MSEARGDEDATPSGAHPRSRLWWLALVAWVLFIWGHSLMNGLESSAESLRWVRLLDPFFSAVGITDLSLRTFLVRKAAHFTEYLILGLLDTAAVVPSWHTPHGRRVPALLIVCVVPCVDECIQLFVPGRQGAPTDVLLDFCGALTGLAIGALITRHRRRTLVQGR